MQRKQMEQRQLSALHNPSPHLASPHPLPKLQGKEAKVQARLVWPASAKNNKQKYSLSFSNLKTHFLQGQGKRGNENQAPQMGLLHLTPALGTAQLWEKEAEPRIRALEGGTCLGKIPLTGRRSLLPRKTGRAGGTVLSAVRGKDPSLPCLSLCLPARSSSASQTLLGSAHIP